jgi:hypothetical protein
MKKMKYIGAVISIVGLVYAAFWFTARLEYNRFGKTVVGHKDLTKEVFCSEFPVFSFACHFFGFDPYGKPPAIESQYPEWSVVHFGLVRHMWVGFSFLFLGSSLATFGGMSRLRTALHYLSVVMFGGTLFVLASMLHGGK